MNMSKKIISCIIITIILCLTFINVKADDCDKYACATCVYQNSSWKWKYDLKSDGNGSAELRFSYELISNMGAAGQAYVPKLYSKTLVSKNFIDSSSNKIFCPNQLHLLYNGASAEIFGEPKNESMTKKTVAVDLLSSESTNNNLSTIKEGTSLGKSCSYNFSKTQGQGTIKVTITPIGDELRFELSDDFDINKNFNGYDLTIEDFKGDSCPEIFGQCGSYGDDKYCSVSKTHHFDVLDRDEAQEGYEEKEAGTNDYSDEVNHDSVTDPTIVGENFCDETSTKRVLSLVGNIIIIAKVLVPLIIILIGSIDLFKAVMAKDDKELMTSIKSLGLRLLLGVFIFFVPTIVDVAFDLVNDGHNDNQCVKCVLNPGECEV